MPVKLTDPYVKGLAAKAGQRVEVFDKLEPGLLVRVSDSGRKTWFLRFRAGDGRQPRFKMGTFPATGVADARDKARAAKKLIEAGSDPSAQARKAKAKSEESAEPMLRTFGDLVGAYFAACEAGTYKPKGKPKSQATIDSECKLYDRHIKRQLASTPFSEIGRANVKTVTRTMLAKGITTQANHAHALVRQVFSFAVEEEITALNPAMGMASPAPKKARERVLTDDELKALWTALKGPCDLADDQGGRVYLGEPVRLALRLLALLLQRRAEVVGAAEDELDLDRGVWVIPADRAKNGRAHVVPLTPAAVELFRTALSLKTRRASPFVFPSPRSPTKPMSPDALTRAMGGAMKALGLPLAGPHDLRRSGASILASERVGVSPFIVSQVLNHITDAGGGSATTRRHYNLHSYVAEKRAALAAWERELLVTVGEIERPGNVTPIRRAE